jgi:tRNA A64-2'-O-ribosylphosphate transferase
MAALLPTFLQSLKALNLAINDLRSQLQKPLRPIWITPDSDLTATKNVFADFHPVICCTVSRRVPGGEASEAGYIQGAGDDTENWAHGLTPLIYWEYKEMLHASSEGELQELIKSLVDSTRIPSSGQVRLLEPTSLLFIATLSEPPSKKSSFKISLLPSMSNVSTWKTSPSCLDVGLGPHKVGSRNLRTALPTIIDFVSSKVWPRSDTNDKMLQKNGLVIACESGKDLSIGVALALLCIFFDDGGMLEVHGSNSPRIDKPFIRRRLGWISLSLPDVNPSRATLQSVNSFLMERP